MQGADGFTGVYLLITPTRIIKLLLIGFPYLLTAYYAMHVTLRYEWERYGRHRSGRETDFSNYNNQIL